MKISVIGAGNVGGMTALRLAEANLGDIVLFDVIKGLAEGKIFDLEDASGITKYSLRAIGTDDISVIENSDITVVTAGLARKPGMSREELLSKNTQILKEICLNIKRLAPRTILIIVTNPLDLMTYLALKVTGFNPNRLFGMGISLDAARFANLISKKLGTSVKKINACVIGSHGEGMLVLPRFTKIGGVTLDKKLNVQETDELVKKTVARGQEIVSLLGNASAYFAPSQAITEIIRTISTGKKRIIGVSAYLNGEYGVKDICIGLPCLLGREGIIRNIELALNENEKAAFIKSAEAIKQNLGSIKSYL